MSFRIGDEILLGKYKAIQNKIEDLKNNKLNALSAYEDRYIKTKIRRYRDKVYNNFLGFNVPEDDMECESFTVISIGSLLERKNQYYLLQIYLDNCAYKIVNKWQNILMKMFLKIRYYKCCIAIELI